MVVLLDAYMENLSFICVSLIILIVLDLLMTAIGYHVRNQMYVIYFKSDVYELNTLFKDLFKNNKPLDSIAFLKLFLGGVVLGLILITMIIVLFAVKNYFPYFWEFALGMFVLHYVGNNLEHFFNILLFYRIKRNPRMLKGQVEIQTAYLYTTARLRLGKEGIAWLFVFIVTERVFFLGGTFLSVAMFFITIIWENDYLWKIRGKWLQ